VFDGITHAIHEPTVAVPQPSSSSTAMSTDTSAPTTNVNVPPRLTRALPMRVDARCVLARLVSSIMSAASSEEARAILEPTPSGSDAKRARSREQREREREREGEHGKDRDAVQRDIKEINNPIILYVVQCEREWLCVRV
jgi:hypothetical protein